MAMFINLDALKNSDRDELQAILAKGSSNLEFAFEMDQQPQSSSQQMQIQNSAGSSEISREKGPRKGRNKEHLHKNFYNNMAVPPLQFGYYQLPPQMPEEVVQNGGEYPPQAIYPPEAYHAQSRQMAMMYQPPPPFMYMAPNGAQLHPGYYNPYTPAFTSHVAPSQQQVTRPVEILPNGQLMDMMAMLNTGNNPSPDTKQVNGAPVSIATAGYPIAGYPPPPNSYMLAQYPPTNPHSFYMPHFQPMPSQFFAPPAPIAVPQMHQGHIMAHPAAHQQLATPPLSPQQQSHGSDHSEIADQLCEENAIDQNYKNHNESISQGQSSQDLYPQVVPTCTFMSPESDDKQRPIMINGNHQLLQLEEEKVPKPAVQIMNDQPQQLPQIIFKGDEDEQPFEEESIDNHMIKNEKGYNEESNKVGEPEILDVEKIKKSSETLPEVKKQKDGIIKENGQLKSGESTLATEKESKPVKKTAAPVNRWADLLKTKQPIVQANTTTINVPAKPAPVLFKKSDFEAKLGAPTTNRTTNDVKAVNVVQAVAVPPEQDPFAKRLTQKLKEIKLKHSMPLLVPRGFVNHGNYCYINATLQALLYCPPFYNLMRDLGDLHGITRENTCTPILDGIARFFVQHQPDEVLIKKSKTSYFSFGDLPRLEPFEPQSIYRILGLINGECLKGRQEDAEEFLSSLLNGINEEILQLYQFDEKKNSVNGSTGELSHNSSSGYASTSDENLNRSASSKEDAEHIWKEIGGKSKVVVQNINTTKTHITEIFGGVVNSVRTAGKEIFSSLQPFFSLQLDIQSEKVRNVEDALGQFTVSEAIQGFTCPRTKMTVDASYQSFLDELPRILILHVKLFQFDKDGGQRKLMKRLNFPIDLDLPKECIQDRTRGRKNYKLVSVIYHEGREVGNGHYIADIYHIGTGSWVRFDDAHVRQISPKEMLSPSSLKTPYILFYRHCDTLGMSKNN